jgi:hypothetical protein
VKTLLSVVPHPSALRVTTAQIDTNARILSAQSGVVSVDTTENKTLLIYLANIVDTTAEEPGLAAEIVVQENKNAEKGP